MRLWLVIGCAISLGCIKAPKVVSVDRATALEQQAGASFPETEAKLAREAAVARPVTLTPDQLDALGEPTAPPMTDKDATDAERIDDWLERHCVGEGNDGLLAVTMSACHGGADQEELVKLVDRVNHARTQVWRWTHEQHPDIAIEEVRKQWRVKHSGGVTCGAWMQRDDGTWQPKSC